MILRKTKNIKWIIGICDFRQKVTRKSILSHIICNGKERLTKLDVLLSTMVCTTLGCQQLATPKFQTITKVLDQGYSK
jgi:hypothetical protein